MTGSAWQVFTMPDLMKKVEGKEPRFFEFLRVPTLSSAIYRLPAGAKDMQAPHLEDEVYVVIEGRARLRIDGKNHDISRGSILFVQATAEHSFFDIEEDLVVLAFFGTSEHVED
jgi:mannose-6-phosphate isomerase-like protein (cupin superfamily)